MESTPEVFLNRIPGSNFAGGLTGIIFTPDPMNPSRGRYETADPKEIAELKAAIKSGAPTIYQDPDVKPYAKSANPVEASIQQANVEQAEKDIEERRKQAQADLANINRANSGSGVATPNPPVPGQVTNTADANQNQSPAGQAAPLQGIVTSDTLANQGLSSDSNGSSIDAARAAAASKRP